MTKHPPTLHMLCGKMASGKSTLTAKLATQADTIVIAEDDWLHGLFADRLSDLQDYARCTRKLRGVMGDHVVGLLGAGLNVVLDFAANTVQARAWMRGLVERSGAAHQMHVLDVPDAVCLARLRARNEAGAHAFAPTEAQFHQFAKHFAPPTDEEGFTLVLHRYDGGD